MTVQMISHDSLFFKVLLLFFFYCYHVANRWLCCILFLTRRCFHVADHIHKPSFSLTSWYFKYVINGSFQNKLICLVSDWDCNVSL